MVKSITSPVVRRRIACLGVFLAWRSSSLSLACFISRFTGPTPFTTKLWVSGCGACPSCPWGTIYDRNMNELAVTVSSTAIEARGGDQRSGKDSRRACSGVRPGQNGTETAAGASGVRTWVAAVWTGRRPGN